MTGHQLAIRVRSRALLVVALILACASQVTSAAGPTKVPIRIGVSLGLSGAYESITHPCQNAYRLWQQHVNQGGGILGHPVEVIVRDDRSDPRLAQKIYHDFIIKDRVDFVLGPYSSPITSAVAPIVDRHGYPMIAAGAAGEEIWKRGYQNVFGMWPPAGRYSHGFLAILADAGLERVAIVSTDDIFALGIAEGAKKWATEYALRVTSMRVEPKSAPNMAAAADAARRSGAQALLLAGHYNEAVQMQLALRQLGWKPAAFYAAVGPALQKFLDEIGTDANGTFSSSVWEARDNLSDPEAMRFLQEFQASHGEPPSYHAATAYAAGQVLYQAIVRAGKLDRAAVRQALYALDANSIVGRYAVDRTGSQIKRSPMIVQWQDGKREIVWPPEMRTAPPLLLSNKQEGSR